MKEVLVVGAILIALFIIVLFIALLPARNEKLIEEMKEKHQLVYMTNDELYKLLEWAEENNIYLYEAIVDELENREMEQ